MGEVEEEEEQTCHLSKLQALEWGLADGFTSNETLKLTSSGEASILDPGLCKLWFFRRRFSDIGFCFNQNLRMFCRRKRKVTRIDWQR